MNHLVIAALLSSCLLSLSFPLPGVPHRFFLAAAALVLALGGVQVMCSVKAS